MALYRPEAFRVDDRAVLLAFAADHPFATLVTHGDDGVAASHVPLLVDAPGGKLRGHLARDNDQLAHLLAGAPALAIFHGPHGYVSPSVYEGQRGVPTWNYVVVHVRGRPRVLDEAGLVAILHESVARFDTPGWKARFGEAWPDVPKHMLQAIAGFEIDVESAEGKWKLSQNRSEADRGNVVGWLEKGDASAREVAALMAALLSPQAPLLPAVGPLVPAVAPLLPSPRFRGEAPNQLAPESIDTALPPRPGGGQEGG
jgi:transcriptional regulator